MPLLELYLVTHLQHVISHTYRTGEWLGTQNIHKQYCKLHLEEFVMQTDTTVKVKMLISYL